MTKVGYKLNDAKLAGKTLPLALPSVELQLDLLESSKASAPKFTLSKNLKIKFTPVTESILRFQITDPSRNNQYQVPTQKTFPLLTDGNKSSLNVSQLHYSVDIGAKAEGPFGFTVTRKDTKEVV